MSVSSRSEVISIVSRGRGVVDSRSVQMAGRCSGSFVGGQFAGPVRSASEQRLPKLPKAPKPPEKPLMPYMRYSRQIWEQVKSDNPDLRIWEIGKLIGQNWRDLAESEKQIYMSEYESEKQEYAEVLKAYHNSPAYQAYLATKSKIEAQLVGIGASAYEKELAQEARMSIQPAEDEDETFDDGYTIKHVAAARYNGNHRLILEIFSETCVPDNQSIVTNNRMTVLRKQVESLLIHQKKLESELIQLECRHEDKKRVFKSRCLEIDRDLNKMLSQKPYFEAMERFSKDGILPLATPPQLPQFDGNKIDQGEIKSKTEEPPWKKQRIQNSPVPKGVPSVSINQQTAVIGVEKVNNFFTEKKTDAAASDTKSAETSPGQNKVTEKAD